MAAGAFGRVRNYGCDGPLKYITEYIPWQWVPLKPKLQLHMNPSSSFTSMHKPSWRHGLGRHLSFSETKKCVGLQKTYLRFELTTDTPGLIFLPPGTSCYKRFLCWIFSSQLLGITSVYLHSAVPCTQWYTDRRSQPLQQLLCNGRHVDTGLADIGQHLW